MNRIKHLALAVVVGACFGAATQAQAQVEFGPEPNCPYGFYDYAPYACAPSGYYGPEWFDGGLFIGAGPWAHGRGFHGEAGHFGGHEGGMDGEHLAFGGGEHGFGGHEGGFGGHEGGGFGGHEGGGGGHGGGGGGGGGGHR